MPKLKVHIILNYHLDPVWLWTKPQGIDEVLATSRTACDLPDEYPEIFITRGEAWLYKTIREIDPVLFARIKKLVKKGRFVPVGGWWIQPDCNLPSAESFLKQAELGKKFFKEEFNFNVTVGYNVDSFGHAATLPDFYNAAGIHDYIFLRPQEHEKKLLADLFTWESPKGSRVTTFRIAGSYGFSGAHLESGLKQAVERANHALGHTMLFAGTGDHGGGPSRADIKWLKEHLQYSEDVELVFSNPYVFFEAVRASNVKLPVVKEELQYHAIGCYSAVHEIKAGMRSAENLAIQAENLVSQYGGKLKKKMRTQIESAWEKICFNQFHDILAGSSIRTTYDQAIDELGSARSLCRDLIVDLTRREIIKLPPAKEQRLVFFNSSKNDFKGYTEFEPWIGWTQENNKADICLTDEQGREIPCQVIRPEAAFHVLRLLAWIEVPALGKKIIFISRGEKGPGIMRVQADEKQIANQHLRVSPGNGIQSMEAGTAFISYIKEPGIRVAVIRDESDTWSHGLSGYAAKEEGFFTTGTPWRVQEEGPLCSVLVNDFCFGSSTFLWQIILQQGEPILRLRLRLYWQGGRKIVKLIIPPAFQALSRSDGCPGDIIKRPLDGREYPLFNSLTLHGMRQTLAIVSKDIFAGDVQPDGTARLTLLRSPYYAHHDPFKVQPSDPYPPTDQGVHEYELALMPMEEYSLPRLRDEVVRQTRPIWMAETTKGMR